MELASVTYRLGELQFISSMCIRYLEENPYHTLVFLHDCNRFRSRQRSVPTTPPNRHLRLYQAAQSTKPLCVPWQHTAKALRI